MQIFRRALTATLLCLASPQSFAISYSEILELSGIKLQIQSLPELIEQSAVDSDCSTIIHNKKLQAQITSELQQIIKSTPPATLLKKHLALKQLQAIDSWLTSQSGIQFQEADKRQELSNADYEAALKVIKKDSHWKTQRRQLIAALIHDSQLHRYVATLNYGIERFAKRIADCPIKQTKIKSSTTSDIEFNAFFIMQYLLEPVAVSYRDISDETLQEMIDFSNTKAGVAYHHALIKTMSDSLGIKH